MTAAETQTIEQSLKEISGKLDAQDRKLCELRHHLVGTLVERGLTRRVEDLERGEGRRNKWAATAVTAGICAIVAWAWNLITGK